MTLLRVADLDQNRPNSFDIVPGDERMARLAAELGLLGLRKVRLSGTVTAEGPRNWRLRARLGATVVQPCVVTLDPVTTRIETEIVTVYSPDFVYPAEGETEMPEDDTLEPLPEAIDLDAILAESLALNLPLYPRATDAELGEAVYTEPGQRAMRDEDARPFAGLAALRDRLDTGE